MLSSFESQAFISAGENDNLAGEVYLRVWKGCEQLGLHKPVAKLICWTEKLGSGPLPVIVRGSNPPAVSLFVVLLILLSC
jgi:hypothetical protein